MNCRHCDQALEHVFLDLCFAPPSNAYLSKEDLTKAELYLPLKLSVCDECWLVQTEDTTQAEDLFASDYAYFSSVSSSWLAHAKTFSQKIIKKLNLDHQSFVVEIAANDGYLLKNFIEEKIPCLGIEPTDSTAEKAEQLNIPILRQFFGEDLAQQLKKEKQTDLIIGNNVYAHVPDINDFTLGLKTLLKPNGTITLEFPHLLKLIEECQFDTVYHEHFSYLSLNTVSRVFTQAGLKIFDVEMLATHGGSLRVYGCHQACSNPITDAVQTILQQEADVGMRALPLYQHFQSRADDVKNKLLSFLLQQKEQGKKVIAYGAAAKGNTLLNYAGIKPDLLSVVIDVAPSKQGKFLPGSHIPIAEPNALQSMDFDTVLILPWNLADEVMKQAVFINKQNISFFVAIPEIKQVGGLA